MLDEPELHLGEDIVVPDLAGWRRERMPALVDDVPYFTLAPDWVCEVLSPSTAKLDRTRKLPVYAREGVGHVWLIEPRDRVLEVLRREEIAGLGGPAVWQILAVFTDDARVRAPPFEAFELELGVLWADVQPPT